MNLLLAEIKKNAAVPDKVRRGDNFLIATLQLSMGDVCVFCGGFGHLVTQCSTKRQLDREFRRLKLKVLWGTVKSLVLEFDIKAMSDRKVARMQEDANDRVRNRVKPL